MSLNVPIPSPKKEIEVYYIPFKVEDNYMNQTMKFKFNESDSMRTIRDQLKTDFKIDTGNYLIAKVHNNAFVRLFNSSQQMDDLTGLSGATMFYEIDPALSPRLPTGNDKCDGYYGIGDEYTMIQINMQRWGKDRFSGRSERQNINIPRLIWVKKSSTLKDLHFEVFKAYR